MADVAALCIFVGAILEFGFDLSEKLVNELNLVYFWAWNMFLIERVSHLLLTKRGRRKTAYNFLGWTINGLLTLTLIPIFIEFFAIDDSIGVMRILGNRTFHLLVLFLISVIELSDAVITSLGKDDGCQFHVHHLSGLRCTTDAPLCPTRSPPLLD